MSQLYSEWQGDIWTQVIEGGIAPVQQIMPPFWLERDQLALEFA